MFLRTKCIYEEQPLLGSQLHNPRRQVYTLQKGHIWGSFADKCLKGPVAVQCHKGLTKCVTAGGIDAVTSAQSGFWE